MGGIERVENRYLARPVQMVMNLSVFQDGDSVNALSSYSPPWNNIKSVRVIGHPRQNKV